MHLHPPTPKGGRHRTLRVLSLLVLHHALIPSGTDANARSRLPTNPNDEPAAESRPYLRVAGNLPLRFSNPSAPRYSTPVKTPAPAPTNPSPEVPAAPIEPVGVTEVTPVPAPEPVTPLKSPEPVRTAPSILSDDTRSTTRPEDFLPFFKFPAGDVTVVVPAGVPAPPTPGQLPASSATYQQR